MLTLLLHPQVATRDCGFCQEVLHDEKTGKPVLRAGHCVNRHAGCPPPCRTERGCPKGTPEAQKTLTDRNWKAYRHYLECKAVGSFPDDPIVRSNAATIRMVEDEVAQMKARENMAGLFGGGA